MKRTLYIVLAMALLLTMSGCGSVFEDEYYYEEPASNELGALSGDATEIRNFSMLKTALTDMISRHEEHGEFRLNRYNGSPSEDLAAACFEIKSEHPLGAYAVETISYDTSYVVSYYMASIYISYKRTAEEIQQIVYALTKDEFDEAVLRAVDSFAPQVVARLYSPLVDEDYIQKLVKRHCYDDPVTLIRVPELTVSIYPQEGVNRIYELNFDHSLGQATNLTMTLALSNRLNAVISELSGDEPLSLALECAAYLSSLEPEGETQSRYPDTAYGALVEHVADSKGLALAYRALCDRLDIPCIVVEGLVHREPHFWNIITIDGANYHVDVSAFALNPARAFLRSDDEFWGDHIWETEDYPACNGTLRYSDVARQEPAEGEPTPPPPPTQTPEPTPSQEPVPEETDPPEETPAA